MCSRLVFKLIAGKSHMHLYLSMTVGAGLCPIIYRAGQPFRQHLSLLICLTLRGPRPSVAFGA